MDIPRRHISAHTLLELIIVVMILGIFAAASAPTFRKSLIHHRVESAARRLKIDLELVQRHAKSRGANQTISFDTATSTYVLPAGTDLDHPAQQYAVDLRKAPYTVTILATDLDETEQIIFDGYGLPDRGAAIRLGYPSNYLDVVVDSQSGHVTIQ